VGTAGFIEVNEVRSPYNVEDADPVQERILSL